MYPLADDEPRPVAIRISVDCGMQSRTFTLLFRIVHRDADLYKHERDTLDVFHCGDIKDW
jgi:hypothetical protein